MVTISTKIKNAMSSIRWKLVVTYFIIILLTISFISVYILNSMRDYSMKQKKIQVLTQANLMSSYIAQYQDLSKESIVFLIQQLQLPAETRVLMLDNDARVIFDSNTAASLNDKIIFDEVTASALLGANLTEEEITEENKLIVNAAVPIIKDKTISGAIYLQSSAEDVNEYTRQLGTNIIIIVTFVSLLVGIISFIIAGIVTNPICKLTKKLEEITENGEEYFLEENAGGEIGKLVESFNKMTDKIEKQEEKRQEFVSNASHELKTPLSSIKLICDSLIQTPDAPKEMVNEFLGDMNVQVDRLTRIIDKLLTLTKMDSQQAVSRMEFSIMNIAEVAANVYKSLKPLADKKNITLTFNTETALYSKIEKDKLWEAIYNILDNSIKYTPEGGTVTMNITKEENCVVIVISDTGIGIAADELYKIFDRFYRVDKARSRETGGTGLGLSIALTAVELHGGNVQVESNEGVGSTFKIIIPITFK